MVSGAQRAARYLLKLLLKSKIRHILAVHDQWCDVINCCYLSDTIKIIWHLCFNFEPNRLTFNQSVNRDAIVTGIV